MCRVIAAFVVIADGAELTDDIILQHARTSLASYKLPRAVHFVSHLPRTPNGKVIRKQLHTLL